MGTQRLAHFPELHNSSAFDSQADERDGENPQLLELRTESGTFYVSPSRWQRLRLRWIFRHFHELPQQVLSRSEQRLIEKLAEAEPLPTPPPGAATILGVIARPGTKAGAAPGPHVVTMKPRTWQPSSRLSPPPRIYPEEPEPICGKLIAAPRVSRSIADAPFRQWGSLGTLAAVCTVVIVLKVSLVPGEWPRVREAAQASEPVVPPPARPAQRSLPTPALPASLQPTQPPAPLLAYQRPTHWFAPARPAATVKPPLPESTSAALPTKSVTIVSSLTKPTFVSELPQGHFAAPVPSNPNQVGELQLKALIAADGSVQDVTLVSGDPKLAAAGMRAVRRWHYNPYLASDSHGERETFINMKFFGRDAVSVTSAAR